MLLIRCPPTVSVSVVLRIPYVLQECQLTAASSPNCSPWQTKKTVSVGSNQGIERRWPLYKAFTKTPLTRREKAFQKTRSHSGRNEQITLGTQVTKPNAQACRSTLHK